MFLSEVRAATASRVILMRTHEERILRVLGKAVEPLFTSEITERLNNELGGKERYTMSEIFHAPARFKGASYAAH